MKNSKKRAGLVAKFLPEEKKIISLLKKEPYTIKELSRKLNKSAAGVVELAQNIKDKGATLGRSGELLYLGNDSVSLDPEDFKIPIKDKEIKIGIIADTILGSKYQQMSALYKAFQIAEYENVDFMIHLGVTAGMPTPRNSDDFFLLTPWQQVDYVVRNYPKSKKFKTRFISGFHDMQWRKKGINILSEICKKRFDLVYRGDYQSDFLLRRVSEEGKQWPILKAVHHGGNNTPYAKSYSLQGYAENLTQDVKELFSRDMPTIVAIGGQGVWCDLSGGIIKYLFSVPGLRSISPDILREKRKAVVPEVGFVIITVKLDKNGEVSMFQEVFPLEINKRDYMEKFSENVHKKYLNELELNILRLLEESQKSLGELTQAVNKSDDVVVAAIKKMKSIGLLIDYKNDSKSYKLNKLPKSKFLTSPINFTDYFFKTVKRGGVSDTHLGHNSELLPILEEAYDVFKSAEIKSVDHCGDATNGPAKHQERNKKEVHEERATPLTEYFGQKYPKRDEIETYLIAGDHDRWYMDLVGYDIVKTFSWLRSDIKYLGIQEGEVDVNDVKILLKHFNWGTGYARSHKPQRAIEDDILKEISLQKELFENKAVCILSGGGHVYCALLYKGVIFVLMPCLQGKTGFISGLGKLSDVGFIIYSITTDKSGNLTKFKIEYFNRTATALNLLKKSNK